MTIYEALNAVKRDLGAVSKNGTMNGGSFKYKYRSIDDVLNKLHPILVDHGVVGPVPDIIEHRQSGKKVVVRVKYTWFAADGSCVVGLSAGEGDDPGDKGTNKAMTGALKTFLAQSLAIPFETDDPDDYPSEDSSSTNEKPNSVKASSSDRSATTGKGGNSGDKSSGSEGARTPAAAGMICGTCGYTIAPGDPVRMKASKKHHKQCLEDGPKAAPEGDIDKIKSAFPGATEE